MCIFTSTPSPRSSHRRCSMKKGVLKNFTKFTENTCARASFLIKYRPYASLFNKVAGLTLLKNDSNRGVFL